MGRREERLGGGGPPVDEKGVTVAVGQADPADVDGGRAVGGSDAAEADVEAEPGQDREAGGEPVDLEVAVECGMARPCRLQAQVGEASLGRPDLAVEEPRDAGEVFLVGSDLVGGRLGGLGLGEGEDRHAWLLSARCSQ